MSDPTSREVRAAVLAVVLAALPISRASGSDATITDLVPTDVCADTVFEVHGAGLALPGLTAALLVPVLGRDGSTVRFSRMPLRVVSVADDRVALRIRSARAGEAFVRLTGARGRQTITSLQTLLVHAPEPASPVPLTAAPSDAVVLTGAWLGAGGALWIGGLRARTTAWTDDAITAVVPARAPDGVHGVEVRNKVGRKLVTGVVEVRGGRPTAAARLLVRERGATRSYVVRSAAYAEATGGVDVYASRTGPIRLHHEPGYWYWRWVGFPRYTWELTWEPGGTWTTQTVWDVRLTATGATFDADGRAVASWSALAEGAHVIGNVFGGHRRPEPTNLVVLFRREPDGALSGSFSGLRSGRLVEGSFRQGP